MNARFTTIVAVMYGSALIFAALVAAWALLPADSLLSQVATPIVSFLIGLDSFSWAVLSLIVAAVFGGAFYANNLINEAESKGLKWEVKLKGYN